MFKGSLNKLLDRTAYYGSMEDDMKIEVKKEIPIYRGHHFDDGIRTIDFILVWEEDPKKNQTHNLFRNKFENNLKKVGLELEEEVDNSGETVLHYIKIFAPWEVMCVHAEELALRAPLQAHPNPPDDWSMKLLKTLHIPNIMYQDVPNRPPDYYTCEFKKSKISRFLGSDNKSTYFTKSQRHQVINEILECQLYGRRRKGQIGIYRMVEEEIYDAAYPLHEGPWKVTNEDRKSPESLNPRQVLYEYWARYGKWYKYQPLDHIREYYGEKIGLYFAWLGLYTAWLLPASIIGILVFLYGVFTINGNVIANEVCNPKKNITMCPLCDEDIGCNYWNLSEVCLYTTMAYLFDHPGTIFYSLFMVLWAVTFLEFWKRKNASLAHHWDVMDYVEEEEKPRPQYAAMCSIFQKNPVTGVIEPYFPPQKRLPRMLTGLTCILIMMIIVTIFIIAVIIYRVLIEIPLFQDPFLRNNAFTYANGSAAVVNLILIMCLGRVYEIIAYKLTEWEMHRSQSDFETQLTIKVFIFQFFNFYSSIFYVAFFKGRFVGYPGHYYYFFGLRNEDCQNGGCLVELAIQLGTIMIGKQIISNIQEVAIPKLKTWFHRFTHRLKTQSDEDEKSVIYKVDFTLIPYEGLFEEYLEMVLQFGFITIFVAAFPLAPFFALLNNWMEIRLDAQKLVCETRRPVAERANSIGIWFSILEVITNIACISNAFLLAFTSEFLQKLFYLYKYNTMVGYTEFSLAWAPANTTKEACRYPGFRDKEGKLTMFYWELLAIKLGFVIAFEHFVFGVGRLLDLLIPDVPHELSLKVKREGYLAKQALQDADLEILDYEDVDIA